ncbi:MAG: SH3 domain-containing protein, partial [Clostridium sp.]|uniref:SH3 domain-containing protein n=1 Tax=Clostridium sp. TaxID=1506 RepID=UPI003EE5F8C0
LMVVDCHGWLGLTQGNGDVGKYFTKQFGFGHTTQYSGGFFSTWANSLSNTKGVLLEYPETTDDFSIVESYATKTFNAIIEIIKGSNGNGGSGSGNEGGSGSGSGNITVGSKVKITGTHWATGQLIPDWAKNTTHTVSKIDGNRALLQEVTSWIYLKDIVLADGNGSGSGSGNGETAYNATGKVINVTSTLNVRSGPGTSYSAIGTLNGGDKVTITHKVKPSGENLDWYKIKFGSGTGYVRSDFVEVDKGSTGGDEAFNKTGKVINVETNLRVRKTPSTSGEVVGTLNANQTVSITHKNGEWYKISSPMVGYVHSDYIKVIGEAVDDTVTGNMDLFSKGT